MLDKNTNKVLKYMNKHMGRVLYSDFQHKFKSLRNPSFEDIEHWLFTNGFAYLTDYTVKDDTGDLCDPQTIALSIEGKQEYVRHSSQSHADKFARITAVVALLLSFVSIIITYLK